MVLCLNITSNTKFHKSDTVQFQKQLCNGREAYAIEKSEGIFLTTSFFTQFDDHIRKCVPSIPAKTYF
jgi:hypothetical protein